VEDAGQQGQEVQEDDLFNDNHSGLCNLERGKP